jgi:hypothetical protein
MKGRKRSKDKLGWVTAPQIVAHPDGTRAERRAWEQLYGKGTATSFAPAPTNAEPDGSA